MIKQCFVWVFFIFGLQLNLYAQEVLFSAQASSQKVGTQDQFQVSFTLSNAPNASNFIPPSFSGFIIEGGPYQSNQSSFSNVNGQTRQTTSVVLTYVLRPAKAGTLTIAPAKIEVNAQTLSTNSLSIQVVNGSVAMGRQQQRGADPFNDPFEAMRRRQQQLRQQMQQQQQQKQQQHSDIQSLSEKDIHKNIFIKVEVDKTNPVVGEQITASYKLYTRLPMSVNLTQLPSLNGFWSQDFQIPNPPKAHEEVINGQPYQVFLLKKSALFPQQDGPLELDAAKAEGTVRVIQQVKGRHPFADDPFFSFFMDDPFFNDDIFSGYDYKDVGVKLSSQPVKINVRPLPTQQQPASFTGAVGHFSLQASLDKNTLSTDDIATLTFRISGSGNLKLIGNPKVNFPSELGITDAQTSDTITSRTPAINGYKVFSYSINPQIPGKYTIPPIPFSYYDPATGQYKTLHTEPIHLTVTKGENYRDAGMTSRLPSDLHDIRKAALTDDAAARQPVFTQGWYWALYALPVIGFLLLLWYQRRQDEYAANVALFKNKKANKVAWKRLASARKRLQQQQHIQFYEEVSKAIWLYLSDKLNIPMAHLSKENIATELTGYQVPPDHIHRVQQLILECEMALYSPSGGQQQRQHTLDEAVQTIGALENVLKNKTYSI